MEIHWRSGRLMLELPEDFKRFKVVVHSPPASWDEVAKTFERTARFDGEQHAWVSQAGLLALAGHVATDDWRSDLGAMIDNARIHGWVDESSGDIKAHVERC